MKRSFQPILILLFLAAQFLSGCKQSTSEISVSNEAKKVDNFLNELVDRQHIPGMAVAVTRNDSVIYTGVFGVRSVDTAEPMRSNYMFHWASVSKTFVATAVMQLVEQGKIDLDEKLITYVPYFRQKEGSYMDITIRQMLNHTSGIGDVDDYEWDKPQNDDGAPERFVRGLENDIVIFAPGKDWAYSNNAFEILGVVIARVSGMSFEEYIRKNIFDPLGMDQSSFIYPEIPDSLKVSGHLWAGKPIVSKVYPYNRIHAPSSTLNSSVEEMTRYAMAHLRRGVYDGRRILSDSSYHVLWTNSVNIGDKPAVGVSWFLDEYKGLKTVSHGGSDTGFRSFLLLVPEKNISVMLACNYQSVRSDDIAHAVLDLLLGNEPDTLKRQIGLAFGEVLVKDGLQQAKAFYRETEGDSTKRKYYLWLEDDGAMAYPGYLFMDSKMFGEAIEVLKFNQELFPNSGYAYAHLGVAYSRAGNKDLAREKLKKAIEMVPDESYFKEELKKLDEK